jgi:hypothetical protein
MRGARLARFLDALAAGFAVESGPSAAKRTTPNAVAHRRRKPPKAFVGLLRPAAAGLFGVKFRLGNQPQDVFAIGGDAYRGHIVGGPDVT